LNADAISSRFDAPEGLVRCSKPTLKCIRLNCRLVVGDVMGFVVEATGGGFPQARMKPSQPIALVHEP
jgi:hypothetical protein